MRKETEKSLPAWTASCSFIFFFFQAEDGIRDIGVTGVQTCALPISDSRRGSNPMESNATAGASTSTISQGRSGGGVLGRDENDCDGPRRPPRRPPPGRRPPGRREGAECEFKGFFNSALTGAESNDAALRIVGRDADGDPVARHHLDAKSPHSSAQLRENFVSGVDLHAVESAAVHRDDG